MRRENDEPIDRDIGPKNKALEGFALNAHAPVVDLSHSIVPVYMSGIVIAERHHVYFWGVLS